MVEKKASSLISAISGVRKTDDAELVSMKDSLPYDLHHDIEEEGLLTD